MRVNIVQQTRVPTHPADPPPTHTHTHTHARHAHTPPPPRHRHSRTLKVSSATDVRKLGNSINYIFEQAEEPPTLLAGGAQAINQAIKGIANARQKPIEFDTGPLDVIVQPEFDGDSARCTLVLSGIKTLQDELVRAYTSIRPGLWTPAYPPPTVPRCA